MLLLRWETWCPSLKLCFSFQKEAQWGQYTQHTRTLCDPCGKTFCWGLSPAKSARKTKQTLSTVKLWRDVWCFLWERSGLTWGVKLVQFLDCYFHGGYHPNRAEQASGFSEASGGLLIANGNVFQRSGSVSSPKSIPEANSLFVMFQQFFCCSYSVINHLAGSEHTQDREGSSLFDMQQSLCTLLRGRVTLTDRWEQQKKGKQQLNTGPMTRKQAALFQTGTLGSLHLTKALPLVCVYSIWT